MDNPSLASRLDQRVTLQMPPDVGGEQDLHGVPTEDWTGERTLWADVKKQAGTLELHGEQLKTAATWLVTVRASRSLVLDATKRFVWTDRFGVVHYLYIESDLRPDGARGDEVAVMCHERPEI